jgi:hypothetical protein
VVRLYGLRNWVESGYKQVKGELGWADFQVPLDRSDPPTWALVCCLFRSPGRHYLPSRLPNPPRPTPRPPRRPAKSYSTMATSLPLACPSPRYRRASGTSRNR